MKKIIRTIDLTNVPLTSSGKYNWKICKNTPINFTYDKYSGTLLVLKQIDYRSVLVKYNNKEYVLYKDDLKRCSIGKVFNFSIKNNYKYDVGDVIPFDMGNLEIQQQKRINSIVHNKLRTVKGYSVKCSSCGQIFDIREGNLDKGDRCGICSNHKIVKGINDLWTLRPDIAKLLTYPEEGYLYTEFSNANLDITCDKCGNKLGKKSICDISLKGLSCKYCSDGISYPNKFMALFLNEMHENYKSEVIFDWCKFPDYKDSNKITFGKYDFVLEQRKLIFEVDGGLGHGFIKHSKSNVNHAEAIYKDKMKDKLALENGYSIIRISCKYKDSSKKKDYMISSIKKNLSKIFDIDNINWDDIDKKANNRSLLIEACNLYNEGLSSGEISEILDRDLSTIIDDLKDGSKYGLCNYKPYARRRKNVS